MTDEEKRSDLQRRMLEGTAPVTKDDWKELAEVLAALSRAVHYSIAELDAVEDVLEEQTKSLKTIESMLAGAGFPVQVAVDEDDENLKALLDAMRNE